jgi:hypothetical protein
MINRHHRRSTAVCWALAAALALVVLEGCEHGNLSFDDSTGTFSLPVGAGSHQLLVGS